MKALQQVHQETNSNHDYSDYGGTFISDKLTCSPCNHTTEDLLSVRNKLRTLGKISRESRKSQSTSLYYI